MNKFKSFRTTILKWLVNHTAPIYMKIMKQKQIAWDYSIQDLRKFPSGSLGWELAEFLEGQNLKLIPKAERHDVFHILTGYKTEPEEETMMQFWLLGNRKWTPYTIGTCAIGCILIPEHWSEFVIAFKKGWIAPSIYDLDYENMLWMPVNNIKAHIQALPFGNYS
ncbi:MAG: hypothetical protein ACPG5P_00685 [Saprospiraceae bacterium]